MFFDVDVLFKNRSSLSLLWIAGNGGLAKKARRSREFQAALTANIVVICGDLRTEVPKMGGAYGLGLKKMGILIKGVGVIYSIKVDQLARDVIQASLSLRRPITVFSNADIDVDKDPKSKKGKTVPAPQPVDDGADGAFLPPDLTINENIGEIREEDFFGEFGTNYGQRSPRAHPMRLSEADEFAGGQPPRSDIPNQGARARGSARKRRRTEGGVGTEEAMYQDICNRLRTGLTENPNAHCIPEDDDNLAGGMDLGRSHEEFDFGDGMAFFNEAEMAFASQRPPSPGGDDMRPEPQTDFGQGPIEFDEASRDMRTPPPQRERTVTFQGLPGRTRNERAAERSEMELGDVDQIPVPVRKGKAVKRRLRLIVDAETQFTLPDMLRRMNEIKAKTTQEFLDAEIANGRAHGKSMWKFIRTSEDFIRLAGRHCPSRRLTEMVQEVMAAQRRRPAVGTPEASVLRDRSDQSSNLAGVSVGSDNQAQRTAAEFEPDAQAFGAMPMDQDGYNDQIPMPGQDYDAGFQDIPEAGDIQPDDVNVGIPPAEQPVPEVQPDRPPRSRRSRSARDEDIRLSKRLERSNEFSEMYPPGKVTRRQAAMALFTLLKMQAKKEVLLHQSEPYGPIKIERLKIRQV